MHCFISSFITRLQLDWSLYFCGVVLSRKWEGKTEGRSEKSSLHIVRCDGKERAVMKEIAGALVMVTKVWPFNKTAESGGSAMCQPHLSRGHRYPLSQCPLIKTGSLPCFCVSAPLSWLMYCVCFTAWCSVMLVWYHNPFESSKVLHLLRTLDSL